MNPFKEKFSEYTDEYLISMRARDDELVDEAHAAIEEIFLDRSAVLPPRPMSPVIREKQENAKTKEYVRLLGSFLIFVAGLTAAKVFAHTWVGIAIAIGAVIYWLYTQSLQSGEGQKEDAAKKADAEGFNELMLKSAEGDLGRVTDLLNYGASLNQQSKSGYTALMLALRNNNAEIVKTLLEAGADASLQTTKGTATLDVAKKFSDEATVKLVSEALQKSPSRVQPT